MRVETMKLIRIATYALMVLFMLTAAAYAGDLIPASKVIAENSGLFQWFMAFAILGSLYLVSRLIKTSEANNDLQWKAINSLNTMFKAMHDEFIEIKTEHRMNHKEKKHEDPGHCEE